jgi:hypothetical protein
VANLPLLKHQNSVRNGLGLIVLVRDPQDGMAIL